ncbi:MAG: MMPL family transporter [Candidatus Heimdallarchaeota archaeon]|nr:MMPL family transporter [Candidatus Heimdallarchaeota archaeon]MCK5142370.1 MMPL family transporter [Candidatus Heimdallarchaeota archaeon]
MADKDNKNEREKKRFIEKYNGFIKKSKIAIIIIWIILLGVSFYFGPKLFNMTEIFFEPPDSAESMQAQAVLVQEFPNFANDTNIIILLRTVENESVLTPEILSFSQTINASFDEFEQTEYVKMFLSYYFFKALNQDDMANTFVSVDQRTTMFVVMYNSDDDDLEKRFVDFLIENVESNAPDENKYEIYLTGMPIVYRDMFASATEDLARMDAIVIPIALVVLAFVLKRLRLIIMPILAILISTFVSFAILYALTFVLPIISFAPSIVMSLTIALAIDYALFLLTRYKEELDKGEDVVTAVSTMTEHAGHTILVSGITLTICFIGLGFFPVSLIATLGLSAAITVFMTLVTNLTLVPAILLTFKKFFSNNKFEKKMEKRFIFFKKKVNGDKKIQTEPKTKDEKRKLAFEKQNKSTWTKITKFSQKRALLIILLIVAAAIPILLQVANIELSLDLKLALPRNTEVWDSYNVLEQSFPAGQLDRHYIVIQTGTTNGIVNSEFYVNIQNLILNLTSRTIITGESFTSICWASNFSIPWMVALYYLNNPLSDDFAKLYTQIWSEYTTADNSTTLIDIVTPFDPYGAEEEVWVDSTRAILEEFETSTGYTLSLAGRPVLQVDAMKTVFRLFPAMVVTIVIVVYIFIAIMFKSVFIPLRLILTIGLTMGWIFGFAVLIFEKNIFDWVAPGILGSVNALYWIVPILSFTVVLGLGLDYDIFLLSRISEYRRKGYSDKASILKGVHKTGGIISAAGVIMAIAFSGLMLSSLQVMNQFGFILCFAVLIDTFVIRTILVPAIMSIAEKWNWWPTKVPKPTKDESYMDDDIL